MANTNHDEISAGDIHIIHNLTYPDASDRAAGTNEGSGITVDASNLYQVAKQDDDDTLWMLTGTGPLAWTQVGAAGGSEILDDIYGNDTGERTVTVDDGDISFDVTGAYSVVVDVSAATGTSDGFHIENGTDYFRMRYDAADELRVTGQVSDFDIVASGDFALDVTASFDITNPEFDVSSGALAMTGDLTLAGGGTITTDSNGDISLNAHGTGISKVGTGSTSRSLSGSGDLLVSDGLEVDGAAYFDAGITKANGITVEDNYGIQGSTSYGTLIPRNTAQTPDTFLFCTGSACNSFIVCEFGDRNYDFAHALQTSPTLFVQSENQSATEWCSLIYNKLLFNDSASQLVFSSGGTITTTANGDLVLDPNGTGINDLDANTEITGTLDVSGETTFGNDTNIPTSRCHSTTWGPSSAYGGFYPFSRSGDDGMFLGVGSSNRLCVVCNEDDVDYAFGHGSPADPLFVVHSNNAAATEYISFTHDQTDAVINWGTGDLDFAGGSATAATVTHDEYWEVQIGGVTKKIMLGS